MKILLLCIITVLTFGCQAPVKRNRKILPDPVNFSWIRNAKELNLKTVNIYYKGVAEGKFLGNKQWRGKITGEIFCKPLEADNLLDGLYIKNGTIKVNKDSTIETEVFLNYIVISFGKKDVNISNGKNVRMSGTGLQLYKTNEKK